DEPLLLARAGDLHGLAVGQQRDVGPRSRGGQQDERGEEARSFHGAAHHWSCSWTVVVPEAAGRLFRTWAVTSTAATVPAGRRVRITSSASPLLLVKIGWPELSMNS